jgi:tRNA threonylcarbamoyladenosine biosynthesis protein TsaE
VSIVSSQSSFSVRCPHARDTRDLGAAIAGVLVGGDVVLLNGELGAGKTTLVKGVVGALDSDEEVTSPTFVLCHFYETDPVIAHVDCWRLTGPREVEDLALLEFLDDGGAVLIEWGDIGRPVLGEDFLVVDFVIEEADGDGLGTLLPEGAVDAARRVRLSAEGAHWKDRLVSLQSRCRAVGLLPMVPEPAT